MRTFTVPRLALALSTATVLVQAQTKIVLTNDDGWDVFNIRQQFTALEDAGFNVVLSAPATDQSGTGSQDVPPMKLGLLGCQFFSCAPFSPPTGSDSSNPRFNYVNSFPVTSVRSGIQTTGPPFFDGTAPDFVVSGPNVGTNLGSGITGSGTVGAACEAAKEGIPSVALSGNGGLPVPFSNSGGTLDAALGARFVSALLAPGFSSSNPILPLNISLNINFPLPSLTGACTSADQFTFVLTRLTDANSTTPPDVEMCGTDRLPTEQSVAGSPGCACSVSVIDANTKTDVDAATQAVVLKRLGSFLSCSS